MNKRIICVFSYAVFAAVAATDPTAPEAMLSGEPALQSPLPKLSLIRAQGKQLLAILDGVSVKTGQLHQGYLIKQISPQAVVLQRGGQQWTLQLFSPPAKALAGGPN